MPQSPSPVDQLEAAADTPAPLAAHLRELRNRLLVAVSVIVAAFGVCYGFKEPLFLALTAPLDAVPGGRPQMVFIGVAELFFTYLKMAFVAGLFIGFPVLLWEIWRFAAPGLYGHERTVARPFLVATPVLFYVGGAFSYFVVMPIAVPFFFQFQTEGITALPSVQAYLDFFLKMTFAFGLAFELPVVLLLLARLGVVTADKLARFRRYAIVLAVAAAAVLTPPDPASQIMLAVPLMVLYELAVWGARLVRPVNHPGGKKGGDASA